MAKHRLLCKPSAAWLAAAPAALIMSSAAGTQAAASVDDTTAAPVTRTQLAGILAASLGGPPPRAVANSSATHVLSGSAAAGVSSDAPRLWSAEAGVSYMVIDNLGGRVGVHLGAGRTLPCKAFVTGRWGGWSSVDVDADFQTHLWMIGGTYAERLPLAGSLKTMRNGSGFYVGAGVGVNFATLSGLHTAAAASHPAGGSNLFLALAQKSAALNVTRVGAGGGTKSVTGIQVMGRLIAGYQLPGGQFYTEVSYASTRVVGGVNTDRVRLAVGMHF